MLVHGPLMNYELCLYIFLVVRNCFCLGLIGPAPTLFDLLLSLLANTHHTWGSFFITHPRDC